MATKDVQFASALLYSFVLSAAIAGFTAITGDELSSPEAAIAFILIPGIVLVFSAYYTHLGDQPAAFYVICTIVVALFGGGFAGISDGSTLGWQVLVGTGSGVGFWLVAALTGGTWASGLEAAISYSERRN